MNFKQFVNENYNTSALDNERKNTKIFLSRYNGNIFTIHAHGVTINYVWSAHAMARFIERNRDPHMFQQLLELTNKHIESFKIGTKYLVKSESLRQAFVIVRDNHDPQLNIITVYPDDNGRTYRNEYIIENALFDDTFNL